MIGIAAVDAEINLLLVIFGLCLGALTMNAFYGWRTLRVLSVKRVVPEVAVAGQDFMIRYVITNKHRWGCIRNILIEDLLESAAPISTPEGFVPILRPGETTSLVVPVASMARGRLAFSTIRLSTRFPFCLFSKWTQRQTRQDTIVFPRLGQMRTEMKPSARSADSSGGASASGRLKGDEEYYGVREFRDGDNPRRIHWRRSAQTGQLMIREMAQASNDQIWCVVNTRIEPDNAAQAQHLELAISAAATVLCDALERGIKVGLICNGEPLVVLPPGSGRAYRPRLLRELAISPRNTDDDLAPHIEQLVWPARWHGRCLLFGAANTDDMRATSRAVSRAIGPATIYVPGEAAFEKLFQLAASVDSCTHREDVGTPKTVDSMLFGVESN